MKKIPRQFLLIVLLIALSPCAFAQRMLSLREATEMATANNTDLAAAAKESDRTSQQIIIARSLFLPTVTASAGTSHYFQLQPFFGFNGITPEGKITYGRFGGADQTAASLFALQPLYNPQAAPSMRRARLQQQQGKTQFEATRIAVMADVRQTYLQLLVLEERVLLQNESLNRNRRVLKDAKALLVQGKALRVDTLRAYTSVRNLEPELLRLTYQRETSELRMRALIGLDSIEPIRLTDSLSLPDPQTLPTEHEIYQEVINSNTDYQLLNLDRLISEQQIRQAAASKRPVVSLIGQYQVQSQATKFDYGNAYYPTSSYAGLQVSVPLFTGFSNEAKVRQAHLASDQSALRQKSVREKLHAVVHAAVADSDESVVRLATTASVKETARLSFSIIQYRYEKGIATRLELTDAELALTSAQSNYLIAIYDYLSARIALDRLMGK